MERYRGIHCIQLGREAGMMNKRNKFAYPVPVPTSAILRSVRSSRGMVG